MKTTIKMIVATGMLCMGIGAASAATPDTTQVKKDSVVVDSLVTKDTTCCADTTKKEKKKESEYAKLMKEGGSVREGLFTVRHIKDDWYLEVPDSLIGRMLLAVTRFTGVPQDFKRLSGEEVNRSAIYLEQYNDKTLLLREYVQSSFAKEHDRIAISLKQSTLDPIIYKFEVIGRNPETQAQLINVTKWLMSENKVTSFSASDRTVLNIGGVQADRSFIDTLKTYPINLEIKTLRTYAMNKGRVPTSNTGSATLSLNTSLVLLPKEPMRPRYFDERVGYFNSKVTTFSDEQQTTDHEAIVMRYRLEPKDLKAYKAGRLVEPKKQIVYYIDPATPKKWVKYLIAGINDWNKAFEQAGFKNAIVGKEWPENDTTMSVDDARFSMIRYLPSETENAYGPRIVDPRSGEIIEAHVCWYHNVMNLVKKWYMTQCGMVDKRARQMDFPDELMGQLIRFVSSHEVGHSLGLRHNMMASNATPVEKLRDKKWVEQHGHTSSIMDYARFNYVAQPEDHIGEKGLFPRINDYDLWAIQWGYQWRPEFKDAEGEKKVLRSEVTRKLQNNRRLWWGSDEGKGQDPRSQTEDLGDNQMKANEYGLKNLKQVVSNLEQWTTQPDGQYDDLNTMHKAARVQYQRYVNHVQRYLNGRYTAYRYDKSTDNSVPGELQREAVQWIGRHVMEAPLWLYPTSIVNKLELDYIDEIRNRQQTIIAMLLSPSTILNLQQATLRSAQPYGVEQYLNDVFDMIWVKESADKVRNNFRRQQQRTYIDFLGLALNPDTKSKDKSYSVEPYRSDAILYLEQHLDKVEQYLKGQTATPHVNNLLLRIKKIREEYTSYHK